MRYDWNYYYICKALTTIDSHNVINGMGGRGKGSVALQNLGDKVFRTVTVANQNGASQKLKTGPQEDTCFTEMKIRVGSLT